MYEQDLESACSPFGTYTLRSSVIYSPSPYLLQGPFYDLQSIFTKMHYEALENLRATPGKGIICAYPYFVRNFCNCCCTILNSARSPFRQVSCFYISFPKQLPSAVVQKGIWKDRRCSFKWQMSVRLGRRGGLRLTKLKSSDLLRLFWFGDK